ncbi:MAG: glycosyltransferase family 4 protein, partial [Acidobacteriales bacterium]|nr:glycosyltransferase family 4 protein [Terriglobales bacterium]
MGARDKQLRIGIDALYMIPGGVGGTEIYLRCLLAALAAVDTRNQYIVYANHEASSSLQAPGPNFSVSVQPVHASVRPFRILWEQIVMPWRLHHDRLDVVFCPGFTMPLATRCPAVVVFHDLQHKRHPEYFRWWDLPFWDFFLWASACRATRLIAVSEATRRDILRYYNVDEGNLDVVRHGVEAQFSEISKTRYRASIHPFLLCVSTSHAHKNLDRLIRAFADFRHAHPEFQLVIAGMRGRHSKELRRLVRDLGLIGAVDFTGWMPREELYGLFRMAHSFIYPSTFEGFGMPVLEALAAGIPTACSEIQPIREIVGQAALKFDPSDVDAIRKAMERIVFDKELRAQLSAEGPARA